MPLARLSVIVLTCCAALAQDQGAPEPPRWVPAARMQTARADHCAVALDDGRIFIAGGTGAEGALSSVEIYGPGDEFAPGPAMNLARSGHTCTKLLDGRILVSGGGAAGSAEIFVPTTSSWTPVRGDSAARSGHSATLLPGGSVVLAGGLSGDATSGLIEIFSPDTESITRSASTLIERRTRHAAVPLSDGRVLIIGGSNGTQVLASTEVYDPVRDAVTPGVAMALPRASHGAVGLPDGRVLIIGGEDGTRELGSAEIYQEADNSMQAVVSQLVVPVRNPFVVLMPDRGIVLIAGGESAGKAIATTQYFLPWFDRFVEVGALTAARTRIAGAALADGVILATGGRNENGFSAACGRQGGGTVSLAPSNTFTTSGSASFTLFFPGQRIRATGRGFPAKTEIKLTLRRPDGTRLNDRLLVATVTTDSAGGYQAEVFNVESKDIGNRFLFGPGGSAQTTVNDGSSNTVLVGELPSTAEVAFDVKASTAISLRSMISTVVTGGAIPVEVTITSPNKDAGTLTGTVAVSLGAGPTSFAVPAVAPDTPFNVVLCCAGTPGTYAISASYSGDAKYAAASLRNAVGGPTVTVVSNQVTFALAANNFRLFTLTPTAVFVRAAASGIPHPTGTVTLRQTTGIPPAASTLPLSLDIRSSAVAGSLAQFDFTAVFVDKPSVCFRVDYSGDSVYPASTNPNLCVPVIAAQPTLEITAPSTDYTFGTPFSFSVRLTFPPELGVTNRAIRLTPPGTDLKLQVGIGTATADVTMLLPFSEQLISLNYTGGGDLAQARGSLTVRMLPAATQTRLDPLPSPASNPIALRATVRSVVPVGTTSAGVTPVPSGTVQFFDGDQLLGQVQTTTNADGSAGALLSNVARPVGARSLRAVYLGNAQFAGSTSAVVPVTIQ